jgi:ketosteroid isomerase-like protein
VSANVDIVRSIFAAWERGDFSSVEWAHPEIEFVFADTAEAWTGRAGMAAGWRETLSAWEGYRLEAEEYRELDGERVLVFLRVNARGKTSGVELAQMHSEGAALFRLRADSVIGLAAYTNRSNARADLGLGATTAIEPS